MANIQLGEVEELHAVGAFGESVQSWLIKPGLSSTTCAQYCLTICAVGFDRSKSYPLAVLIHGGPQGSFKDGWLYRW